MLEYAYMINENFLETGGVTYHFHTQKFYLFGTYTHELYLLSVYSYLWFYKVSFDVEVSEVLILLLVQLSVRNTVKGVGESLPSGLRYVNFSAKTYIYLATCISLLLC